MKKSNLFISAFSFILVILAFQSLYVVTEIQRAVLLRFGEIVQFDVQPGLHFKIPVINSVRYFID